MIRRSERARRVSLATVVVSSTLLATVLAGTAPASAKSPALALEVVPQPTVFNQAQNSSGMDVYHITVTDRGAAPTDGSPIVVTDELPAGFTLNPASPFEEVSGYVEGPHEGGLSCTNSSPARCTFTGTLDHGGVLEIFVAVTVPAGAPASVLNTVSVSGGGPSSVSATQTTTVGAGPAGFGPHTFDAWVNDENGLPVTQAGSHPYEASTSFRLNTVPSRNANGQPEWAAAGGSLKDVRVDLPPGLIGDPNAVPQCTEQQFHTKVSLQDVACPDDSAVGVVSVFFGVGSLSYPVYNLVPPPGMAASFGFSVLGDPIVLNASVRTGGDYGVQINVPNISEARPVTGTYFTFWGVPGDPGHDQLRGHCVDEPPPSGSCPSGLPLPLKPFLTLPTSCLGPQTTTLSVDSWAAPGEWTALNSVSHDNSGNPLGLDGCGRLDFSPQISVAPDGTAASTPTGLSVDVHVPQDRILVATSLAESTVKDTTVALPAGVVLNPAAADGLLSCSTGLIGFQGSDPQSSTLLFSSVDAVCPDASKVATVEIETPLLANKLTGAVYLAAQSENPFGSLVALYIVAKDPVSGVLVKLAGQVSPDPVTGQLVSTFKNTPQLPFSDLRLHFFGTARAPLGTPALCGAYTTMASIAPWSGNEPATPSSSFQVTSGPNGTGCQSPLPFAPSLTAGSTNIQAGAFTPFATTMSREDGNQSLQGIVLHMPAGLSGLLTGVKLCGEAEANAGTCGPESLIGETIVSVGLGGSPFSVRGGRVYITGPYRGAPFGLSIVNPAKAGPYDLERGTACDCVVVRASIGVDPVTAALTVTTDDTGPFKIPTIISGIPLQIQHVNVTITRPGFTFNPTNCAPMAITGSLLSTEGATRALSVPFQVTNCATLGFKPQFHVSTAGRTSRSKGASLDVKLAYPKAPFGSQANISKVKVDLPKQLPSRLTTLQKACPDSTFNENPAVCPQESRVGQASATTPLIPVSLSGPAYFVSHGGAKFPELIIVLQGYGVTVDLHGETFINKAGITSSTFRIVPDVPVGSFELKLPQGKYSALAANGNLCASKLKMPTAFTAQNGAVIHQNTPIGVTGCTKHKRAKRARRAHPHNERDTRKGKR